MKKDKKKKILKYVGISSVGFFLATGIFLYVCNSPPEATKELIRTQAENQISSITGLVTNLGKVSKFKMGIFQQTVVIENINILNGNNFKAESLLKSKKLEVGFNAYKYFFSSPEKSNLKITIIEPEINLNRKKDGNFDIKSPLLNKKSEKSTSSNKELSLPEIDVSIKNGKLHYIDSSFPNKLDLKENIDLVTINLKNSQALNYEVKTNNDDNKISLLGYLNIKSGKGNLKSNILYKNISKLVNVFYDVSKGKNILKQGDIGISGTASWSDFKVNNLKFKQDLNLKNFISKTEYYDSSIIINSFKSTITESSLNIDNLDIKSNNSDLILKAFGNYNGNNPNFNVFLDAKNLAISDIMKNKFIPESVKQLNIKGILDSKSSMKIAFSDFKKNVLIYPLKFDILNIKSTLNSKNGTFLNSKYNEIKSKVEMNEKDIILTDFSSKIYKGNVSGNFRINDIFKNSINKTDISKSTFNSKLKITNLDYPEVLKDFKVIIPAKFNPSGKITGDIFISGKLTDPNVKGTAYTDEIKFINNNNLSIKNVKTKFNYLKNDINVNMDIFDKNNIDFSLKNLDKVTINTKLDNLKSNILSNFIPVKFSSGEISGDLFTEFYLSELKKVKNTEEYLKIIKIKTDLDIKNNDIEYSDVFKSFSTSGKIFLENGNGKLKSKITSLRSNQYKDISGYFSYENNLLKTNFNITSLRIDSISKKINNLNYNNGFLDLKSNTQINILDLKSKNILGNLVKNSISDTNFKIYDLNLAYKINKDKKLKISKINTNLDFKLQNGIVKSNLNLKSLETGEIIGYLNSDKNGNFNSNINTKQIDVSKFNLVNNLAIKKGKSDFNLKTSGNFNNIDKTLVSSGNLYLKNFDSQYFYQKNNAINFDSLTANFNYKNNKLSLVSELFFDKKNTINLNLAYNLNKDIKSKVIIKIDDVSKIDNYYKNKNFFPQKGKINIDIDFLADYKTILNNIYDFNLKTKIDIDKTKFSYIYKNEKIAEEIDSINLDLKYKNFLVDSSLKIKKNKSELLSNQKIDINTMLSGSSNSFGSANLSLKTFEVNDFNITKKIIKITSGKIDNFMLNLDLFNDLEKIKANVIGDIIDLKMDKSKEGVDKIHINAKFDNNILNINNIYGKKDLNYIYLSGTANIGDLSNPKLDLDISSRKFPIKYIFALVPLEILEKIEKVNKKNYEEINKELLKKQLLIKYKMPKKSFLSIKDNSKEGEKNLQNLIDDWNYNKISPETDEKEIIVEKHFWNEINGDLSINATIKGDLKNIDANSKFLISNANIYETNFSEMFLDASYEKGNINIPKLHVIENEGGFFNINGNMNNEGKLYFETDGKVNIKTIRPFLKNFLSPEAEGDFLINGIIEGTKDNPKGMISIDSKGESVLNDIYLNKLALLVDYKNKVANILNFQLKSGIKEAHSSGVIPTDSSLGDMLVSLYVEGESLGLVNLFTKSVDWVKGQGDLFTTVMGSLEDPTVLGKVNILDASIYLPSLNKSLEKVNVDLNISNNEVKINNSSALLNGSKAGIFGSVSLNKFKPTLLKLNFSADNFSWEQDNMNITSNLRVSIKNTISEPLIGGIVEIKKGEYNLLQGRKSNSATTPKIKDKIKPSSDIQYNKLRIEIPENTDFWVKSPFFELKPTGKITLKDGDLYNPVIDGKIKIDKGTLSILNTEFNIKEAEANFTGKEFERGIFPLNPELTVIATTKIMSSRLKKESEVEAKITGDFEKISKNEMNITWSKTDGLTDSEIWTQVAGLNAAQELLKGGVSSSGDVLAKFAKPYLNRALFSPLTSKVADLFQLDEFNVGLATDTLTSPGVSISLSKPIPFIDGLSLGYQGIIKTISFSDYKFFARYRLGITNEEKNKNPFFPEFSLKADFDQRNSLSLQGELGWIISEKK